MGTTGGPRVNTSNLVLTVDPKNQESYQTDDPNLLNPKIWTVGSGRIGSFNDYSSNNRRIIDTDPFGQDTVVWEGYNTVGDNNGSGIYNSTQAIDNTKLYRMSFWEKRITNGDATYARYYFGLNGYGSVDGVIRRDTGNNNTNPYFYNTSNIPSSGQIPLNTWMLIVGHIFPAGSGTGDEHPDSGRYTISSGRLGGINKDFIWRAETTIARSRTLSIYRPNASTTDGVLHHSVYPRLDIVDGTEPSIDDLLNNRVNDVYVYDRSTNRIQASLVGNVTHQPSEKSSLYLPDTYNYIDLGQDYVFKTSGGWTVESWVKYDTIAGSYDNLLSPANFIGSDIVSYNSWYWSVVGNRLALWNIDPGTWRYGSTTLQPNTWYHVVLVCQDSGTSYQMYLNGIPEGGNHTTYSWNASYSGLRVRYIGAGQSDRRFLDGNVGLTRIYTEAFTDDEVFNLFKNTRGRFGV